MPLLPQASVSHFSPEEAFGLLKAPCHGKAICISALCSLCCLSGTLRLWALPLRSPPPYCHLPCREEKEIPLHKPSALTEDSGELIPGPFLRVAFWALRSAGCVTWTRPGTSVSPNIPSPGWTECLRKAAFPLATTSGKPPWLSRGRSLRQLAPKTFLSSRNAHWEGNSSCPSSGPHQVSVQA